jgi:hypothetical protein
MMVVSRNGIWRVLHGMSTPTDCLYDHLGATCSLTCALATHKGNTPCSAADVQAVIAWNE